jgi:hypothetical protein
MIYMILAYWTVLLHFTVAAEMCVMLGCMVKTCFHNFFISVLYHELKNVMIVVTERRRWEEGREEM